MKIAPRYFVKMVGQIYDAFDYMVNKKRSLSHFYLVNFYFNTIFQSFDSNPLSCLHEVYFNKNSFLMNHLIPANMTLNAQIYEPEQVVEICSKRN